MALRAAAVKETGGPCMKKDLVMWAGTIDKGTKVLPRMLPLHWVAFGSPSFTRCPAADRSSVICIQVHGELCKAQTLLPAHGDMH